MKNYIEEAYTRKVLDQVVCDCCKNVYENDNRLKDVMEIEEFISIDKTNGYGSIFEDESKMKLDLCQHCVKKLLGDYIKIEKRIYE